MMILILLQIMIAAMPITAQGAAGDTLKTVYKHPTLPFQFQASPAWRRIPWPGDEGVFEMASPDGKVHVVMWQTTSCQGARKYLIKMAHMKDLDMDGVGDPDTLRTEYGDGYAYEISGREREKDVRTLLAVIVHGKSAKHPDENALYIIQIWCPEDISASRREAMKAILESVRITDE